MPKFVSTKTSLMKRHRNFEFYAGEYLKEQGYQVEVTQGVADWGVDIFCEKDCSKYAVQVKMYGTSKTKISRKQIFELYGVMAYFGCQSAKMIYNGGIMTDAILAAEKLHIELIELDYRSMEEPICTNVTFDDAYSFETIWDVYIRPLANRKISDVRGFSASVGEVTDGYIERINSKGKKEKVKSDLYKWIIDRIHIFGFAESIDLRNEFRTIHSPFVTLVFANIPICKVTYNPRRIEFREKMKVYI